MAQDNWNNSRNESMADGAQPLGSAGLDSAAGNAAGEVNQAPADTGNNFLNNILDSNSSVNSRPNNPNVPVAPLPKLDPIMSSDKNALEGTAAVKDGNWSSGNPNISGNQKNNPENNIGGPNHKEKNWLVIIISLIIVVGLMGYIYLSFVNNSEENSTSSSSISTTSSASVTSTVASLDETRSSDLTTIQKALEQYYLANSKYPIDTELTRTQDENCPLNNLVSQYLEELPVDPGGSDLYYGYKSDVAGTTYELSAIFDDKPDGVESIETSKGFLVTLTPGTVISDD